MRSRLTASIVALALASVSGSACAMDRPMNDQERCRVTGADKLPAEIGGAPGICAAIERAAASAGDMNFAVDVRVISPARLAATVTMSDGRVLPERHMAVSDSKLRKSSLERFARGLAAEIAKARA
jgi:hypothetical protein